MKKILLILSLLTATAYALDVPLYQLKEVPRIKDNSRFYIYDNQSGSRNLTGAQLKKFQRSVYINSTTPYRIYNSAGKVVQEVTNDGCLIIH